MEALTAQSFYWRQIILLQNFFVKTPVFLFDKSIIAEYNCNQELKIPLKEEKQTTKSR